jgi:MFS superfamily sulfate permease-like transporter/CRP-like cAMP-binding protein
MPKINTSTIRGDLSGGFSAAMMSLPANIIYGLIGFAPLGPNYTGIGLVAGIYSSVFAGFASVYFGGSGGMITCACATMVLVFASVLRQVIALGIFDITQDQGAMLVLGIGFFTILLAGVIQILFGLLKLSNLIRYISAPVIAGIMNGTAILIITGAILDYLGLPKIGLSQFMSNIGNIQPLTIIVALTSTLLWLHGNKLLPKVPGPVLSLFGGTAVYYLFSWMGFGDQLGQTLQSINVVPLPKITTTLFDVVNHDAFTKILPITLTGAAIIAILGSIESLLAVLTLQNLTNERVNGNKELVGQGIGNVMNAIFGALPAGGAVSRVIVNYKAGGRTKMSGYFYAVMTLVIVLLFSRYLSYMPKAVTAGMAAVIAYLVTDKWSFKLARDFVGKRVRNRKGLLINAGVILLVLFIVVRYNIIYAVSAGIIISIILFSEQMSKSVVRRVFRGSNLHSKKQRYVTVMETLHKSGDQIAVIELEGPLFFGAIDSLSNQLDTLVEDGAKYILLDFKRVNNVDASAAKFLEQCVNQLRLKGVKLAGSYIFPGTPIRYALEDMGVIQAMGEESIFNDTVEGLEFCEDLLLDRLKEQKLDSTEFSLHDFFGFKAGKEDDTLLDRLSKYLNKVEYNEGETIFAQGQPGDSAYIIASGQAEVTLTLPGKDRHKRLVTLSYGTMIGEMALLDSGIRSANVEVLEKLTAFRISVNDFIRMREDDPDLAMIMTETITRILIARLRQANQTISELEI